MRVLNTSLFEIVGSDVSIGEPARKPGTSIPSCRCRLYRKLSWKSHRLAKLTCVSSARGYLTADVVMGEITNLKSQLIVLDGGLGNFLKSTCRELWTIDAVLR